MPTVKVFIRTTSNNKDVNIRFRYSNGRNIQLFHKSEIFVNPTVFDEKKGCVKAKVVFDTKKRTQIDTAIVERVKLIRRLCDSVVTEDKTIFNSEWLEQSIDKELHPEKYKETGSFFQYLDEFLTIKKYSDWRVSAFNVVNHLYWF